MKLRNKKTGEVGKLRESKSVEEAFFVAFNDKSKYYGSLAELNEEWEDYKPAEPLIKDEKIRKVIRAWAEVNSVEEVLYAERTDKSLFVLTDMGGDDTSIMFVGWVPTLKDGADYTIAELCGEQETPEPLEPTFIDLDERIKEREEE